MGKFAKNLNLGKRVLPPPPPGHTVRVLLDAFFSAIKGLTK